MVRRCAKTLSVHLRIITTECCAVFNVVTTYVTEMPSFVTFNIPPGMYNFTQAIEWMDKKLAMIWVKMA